MILPNLADPAGIRAAGKQPLRFTGWLVSRPGSIVSGPFGSDMRDIARMTAKIAYSAAFFDGYSLQFNLFQKLIADPFFYVGRPSTTIDGPVNRPYFWSHEKNDDWLVYYIRYFTAAPMPYHFEVVLPL